MFPFIPANSVTAPSGNDEGIFYGGYADAPGPGYNTYSNKVSNTGVVATNVTSAGTARHDGAACEYGGDKGIFGYGQKPYYRVSVTNLVSNTGVISSDVTGVGTIRNALGACGYGEDKGIFGYGYGSGGRKTMTNLVSNTGVV